MKNLQIILFSMAMLLSLNSNGQMIVDQQGEVGIGSSYALMIDNVLIDSKTMISIN